METLTDQGWRVASGHWKRVEAWKTCNVQLSPRLPATSKECCTLWTAEKATQNAGGWEGSPPYVRLIIVWTSGGLELAGNPLPAAGVSSRSLFHLNYV
jgi:hypothetical protein